MKTCRIHRAPPRVEQGVVRLEAELELPDVQPYVVFFEYTCPDTAEVRPAMRPFLLAALVPAMHAGLPLQLDGPLDPVTYANLMEWQAAYSDWRPRQLRVVPILSQPEAVSPSTSQKAGGALTAFSGGVDSCFTVHQQTRPACPDDVYRRIPLRAGLMVHGFDIPLEQGAVFESAWQNSVAILAVFGLQAFRLRTNLRTVGRACGCDWETEGHGIWLAAALACLEPWFDGLVIPSSYPYSRLILPWGSNPVTDPLLGGAQTPCWHDGAGHNKLTKVLALAADPTIAARVRVCWQGRQLDRNCGHCFKCIATQICFWLAGVPRPAAFPSPCTLAEVARVPVKNQPNDFLLEVLESRARSQGWPDLASALRCARTRGRYRRRWTALRRALSQRFFP